MTPIWVCEHLSASSESPDWPQWPAGQGYSVSLRNGSFRAALVHSLQRAVIHQVGDLCFALAPLYDTAMALVAFQACYLFISLWRWWHLRFACVVHCAFLVVLTVCLTIALALRFRLGVDNMKASSGPMVAVVAIAWALSLLPCFWLLSEARRDRQWAATIGDTEAIQPDMSPGAPTSTRRQGSAGLSSIARSVVSVRHDVYSLADRSTQGAA